MNPHARRLAVLLSPLLLVTACGWSGQQHTARVLNDRLQFLLARDIAAGKAAVQPMPDGARVTLLGTSAFPTDTNALAGEYPATRAKVIEALLDPKLMRIQLADTSALPADQRAERVQNVAQYFQDFGLGSTLVPAAPSQTMPQALAGPAPSGLTITISVQCPHVHRDVGYSGAGYGDGTSKPVCD